MTHFVVTASKGDQNVTWKEKVDDEAYNDAVAASQPVSVEFEALSSRYQQIVPVAAFAAKGDTVCSVMSLGAAC